MKSIKIYTLLLSILALSACVQENHVKIKGRYADDADILLQLNKVNSISSVFIDSTRTGTKGVFKFDFELENPELIVLSNSSGEYINLLASPGEKIQLDIPKKSFKRGYTIEGSEESEKIRELVYKVEESKVSLDSLMKEIKSLSDMQSNEGQTLSSEYMKIFNEQKKYNIEFIINNILSPSSVYALYQRVAPNTYIFNSIRDLQYFKIVSDSLQGRYPESSLVQSLVADVNKRMDDYNKARTIGKFAEKNVVETGLINLEIENQLGETVSLKSLEGKVVLLLFWGSWNEESKATARALKKVYDEYHSRGFEIYAVGLESDRNSWRGTIDFEEFNWINVSELSYPKSYAAMVYNVQTIPTTFMINREGDIVAKNLSLSVIRKWLDNLL